MMQHAVTIVLATPDAHALAHLQPLFTAGQWRVLSEHKAFEWLGTHLPPQVLPQINAAIPNADVFIMPAEHRRKTMLVADMDSTIIAQECIDELADYCGIKPQVAAITEAAMNGAIDFVAALTQRVALLKGLTAAQIEACRTQRITYTKGAPQLLKTMTHHGAQTLLISGGFECFVAPIARDLGFTAHKANQLDMRDGVLTGIVTPPFIDRAAKKHFMQQYAATWNIAPQSIMAVGDGANDLDMLQAAGAGVAFYAKEVVAKSAAYRVQHTDLTSLLYMQGYSDAEIVS
jgi:phosphoserine phosphatase